MKDRYYKTLVRRGLYGLVFFFLLGSGYAKKPAPFSVGKAGSMTKARMVIHALLDKDYNTATAFFKDEPVLLFTPSSEGITPLALAIRNQDDFMLHYLLKQGVPLASPYYLQPPLVQAMYSNNIGALEALLSAGSDVSVSYHHLTLLQIAVLLKRMDFCTVLLQHGASIDNALDKRELSPLAMALIQGQWDIVGLLVQVSSNLNLLDSQGRTPLDILIAEHPSNVGRFLNLVGGRKKEILNFTGRESPPPIFFAIRNKDEHSVQKLLANGADVNIRDIATRATPLIEAVKQGDQDMVELILSYHPLLTQKDKKHHSALYYAKEDEDIKDLLGKADLPNQSKKS